jgi:hypothetical protein
MFQSVTENEPRMAELYAEMNNNESAPYPFIESVDDPSGERGIFIPEASNDLTEEEISGMIQFLEEAEASIEDRRESLARDAVAMGIAAENSGNDKHYFEPVKINDSENMMFEAQSIRARSMLEGYSLESLTQSTDMIRDILL